MRPTEYLVDLTQQAREDHFDAIIGRDREMDKLHNVLLKRTKKNALLIGDAGVGKTAIVEELARNIVNEATPTDIMDCRILQLDVTSLMSGTSARGDLEEKVNKLLHLLTEDEHRDTTILFIDEIHILTMKTDSPELNVCDLFKPFLARGIIRCIGATTYTEYEKYFKKDKAFTRRFQPIFVHEPSCADTLEMLRMVKKNYEDYHQCVIDDAALVKAVEYADKYIPYRHFPDKAIDLIDEACSKCVIDARKKVGDIMERMEMMTLKKTGNIGNTGDTVNVAMGGNPDGARGIPDGARGIPDGARGIPDGARGIPDGARGIPDGARGIPDGANCDPNYNLNRFRRVDVEMIDKVMSCVNNYDIKYINSSENDKILAVRDRMLRNIIGQEAAIQAIVHTLRKNTCGLNDPARPLCSLMFVGPTGVGKTECVRLLTKYYYGDERHLLRFDMSEYMESMAAASLIGAPPGYVGFKEGGKLTNLVKRNPHSVVLFDEIEKAHPSVHNLLLQIMEDGVLTDSSKRTVSFKNCVIIMTSNAGYSGGTNAPIGFSLKTDTRDATLSPSENISMTGSMSQQPSPVNRIEGFRPEFLNRIDRIVHFKRLSEFDIALICETMIDQVIARANEVSNIDFDAPIRFEVSEATKRGIIEEATQWNMEYGARPLNRAITRHITDRIADHLLTCSTRCNSNGVYQYETLHPIEAQPAIHPDIGPSCPLQPVTVIRL
jgi:ATP-dependent Clp protease ATP-binding subunit ClpC